ncbi:olfactory receptor 2M2-like [Mantella aurantiaca]
MNCTAEERVFRLSVFSLSFNFHLVLFFGILMIYLISVSGNLVIIGLVYATSHLHTPMYYFLCNLSVQDIIYVSATLPKFLYVTISGDSRILFPECITQMFFFTFCVGTDFFLLTFMAYDRYVAVCLPLSYTIIMNPNLCVALCSFAWLVGFCNAFTHAILVSSLFFCHSQDISHFYCDLKAMIELSSSDVSNIETMVSVECIFLGVIPFVLILASYTCIIATIINIQSSAGRSKAFSSCSSHLTVLILFYGPSLSSYLIPQSENAKEQTKMLSLLYTALVPMLNPLVYSLRNKQVLTAAELFKERCLKC